MIFQGIIFDLDGVICSTDEYHYQAWKELADREGIPFDRSVNNRLRGVSRMESLEILLERAKRFYSQEEKEKMAAAKNTRYQELLREMTPADLSPEVFETLETLRKQGLKLAIGSSSKTRLSSWTGLAWAAILTLCRMETTLHVPSPPQRCF